MYSDFVNKHLSETGWSRGEYQIQRLNDKKGFIAQTFKQEDKGIIFRLRKDWDEGEFPTDEEAKEELNKSLVECAFRTVLEDSTKENNLFASKFARNYV